MQRAGSPSSRGDAGSRQVGSKGQAGGRGPEEAALDGRSPQGGKATWEPRARPQQSYRTTRTAQKGEPRALHLEKVTPAAEVSLTEEAREDSRRQPPARRPWAQ